MTTMQRRTFLKGVAGMAGAVMLGACRDASGRRTEAGQRPTLRVDGTFTGLGRPSAYTYTAGPGYWRMSLIFDTLLWPDSTGQPLPWLASSHRASPDGLVHTLDLRDVKWDDGKPMTANDVAFTYDYYRSKLFTPLLVGVPRTECEVIPLNDRTVEFRLTKPDATFVDHVLATMPITPEHVWSGIEDPMSELDEKILYNSTGAYRLVSRDENQGNEAYDAKDGYFLGKPYVRRIEMRYPPNDDPLSALRIGELDCAPTKYEGSTNAVLDPFRDNPEYGMISEDAGFAVPLYFNLSKGGALADVRFRRACLHAIDRQDMVDRLLTGNGVVGKPGWLPPSHEFYDPGAPDYPFDRAEAERLLDEAGYRRAGEFRRNPDGSPLRYTLYLPNVVPVAIPELVANSLRAVGIEIDLQVIELVQLFGTKLAGTGYELLVTTYPGPAGTAPNGDADAMRLIYHSRPPGTTFVKANGYSNPEVDRLLDEQIQAVDVAQRKQLFSQIQRKVAEDVPVAMLYYTKLYFVYRKAVFDQWYYTPGGFATGIQDVYNKQVYITGQKTGIKIREA